MTVVHSYQKGLLFFVSVRCLLSMVRLLAAAVGFGCFQSVPHTARPGDFGGDAVAGY